MLKTVCVVSFFFFSAGPMPLLFAQDKEGFVLVKKDVGIAIYERWITFPNSDPPIKAREVKGEFTFNGSVYEGLNLLKDEKRIKQWQHHVSEFKVYPQTDSMMWMEYSYHDIPWPVSDQDHFLVYNLYEKSPGKVLFITFRTKHDEKLAPVRKDVTRMYLSGSWTFEQITPQKTKATYRILSKPIGIPKIFTDPIIRNNLMTTLKNFIVLMEN